MSLASLATSERQDRLLDRVRVARGVLDLAVEAVTRSR